MREARDGVWTGAVWRPPPGKRGVFLHRRLVEVGQRGVKVRRLGSDRAGEIRITRFLRNSKVSSEAIFEEAAQRTLGRVRGLHILAIQDTTSLRDDGAGKSVQAHPLIAVDAESGALLGLAGAEIIARDGVLKASRKSRPSTERQSRRWLDGAEKAARLKEAGAACVTVIADRESDIYELFAARPEAVELLIRANHDRALADAPRLFAHLAAQPEAGCFEIALPAAPGRKARTARIALRFCSVDLKRPVSASTDLAECLSLYAVEAREVDPPDGVTPAHWRLLTTHRVEDLTTARWIAGLYRRRWLIEELFRTCKAKGFDVERIGLAEGPFEILCAATLVAAISVLALVQERDGKARRPLEDVFQPDEAPALAAVCKSLEGKTQKQKNPHPQGSLAYAAWVCARLGGWTGYYGKPGPIVMLHGLHQFRAIQRGWSLAHNV